MPAAAIWVGMLASALGAEATGSGVAPVRWSPDGTWVAYTLATRAPERTLPRGWLLEGPHGAVAPSGGADEPRNMRLWASRPSTGDHVLLEESAGPISSPAWAPDGGAIAYVRLNLGGGGLERPSWEVVIQDRPGERRILHREALATAGPEAGALLGGAALAWSPDGAYLAVPRLDPPGLEILRADDGRPLKTLVRAFAPAWSPAGGRLAFFQTDDGGAATLGLLGANLENPRSLIEVPGVDGLPGPIWSRDGRSVFVLLRGRAEARDRRRGRRVAVPAETLKLVRLDVATGQWGEVQDLVTQPIAEPDVLRSATFSLSADGTHLFFATNTDQKDSQITWAQPEREMIQVRFNPIDRSIGLEALALEPDGPQLAFRAGAAGPEGPVAICDPLTQAVTPLVPDDAARAEWLALLVGATLDALSALPAPGGDRPLERATPLPAPFELDEQTPDVGRLRRLARIARPLCDRPDRAPPADPGFRAALDAARFAFDYLRLDDRGEHYRNAAASLAALEAQATTPGQRFRLLCLRAQVNLGLGEPLRAHRLVAYLRDSTPWPLGQFEETPFGAVLTPTLDPDRAWLDALEAATHPAAAAETPDDGSTGPLLRPPMGTPRPGPGLPPSPAPAPVVDGRINGGPILVVP